MRNKEKIKRIYENIEVSKELEQKILNSTIYSKNKKRKIRTFSKYAIVTVLLLFMATIGVSAYIVSYSVKIKTTADGNELTFSSVGKVSINDNVDFICENLNKSDIESTLHINLLCNEEYPSTLSYNHCKVEKTEDGEIRTIELSNDANYQEFDLFDESMYQNKYLTIKINMMTNKATKEDEDQFQEIIKIKSTTKDIESFTEDYKIKNLGVDSKIVLWSTSRKWPQTFCFFVYNNVVYNLQGYNIDKQEMIEILENLK